MSESFSLRDHGGHAALGAGLAASLGAFLPADAWAQAAPAAGELPQISVEGAGTGEPANVNQTATGLSRLPGRVQDTPQTINVVPRELIVQQGATTLEQALRNVPGVTVSAGEGNGGMNGDQFRIRGFQTKNDTFIDGLRDFSVYQRDVFNVESVQVIKGPSSEAFGVGTIGAAINQVSKRSFLGNSYAFEGFLGSGIQGRTTMDVNHQIGPTTAVRVNAMYNGQDVADRNHVKSDRWGVALSAGFGIGTDTQWWVNYFHQHTDRTPDYGVPTILPPGARFARPATEFGLPRQTSYIRSTDRDRSDVDTLSSLMKWDVTDWLTISNDTRLTFFSRDFAGTPPSCNAAPCSPAAFLAGGNPFINYGAGGGLVFKQEAWGIENVTAGTAKFNTGPFRHEAVFGLNYYYVDEKRTGITVTGLRPPQLIRTPAFQTSGYAFVTNPNGYRWSQTSDLGLFAQDRMWITDQVSLLAGVRWDDFSSRVKTNPVAGVTRVSNDDSFVSPKASLIIEPFKDKLFYLTWARSTTPTGSYATSATGGESPSAFLPPEKSELIELGTKLNFLDGKLGISASLFRVDKTGSFDVDPTTGLAVAGPLDAGEGRRVMGGEVGITGNITDQWQVSLAYARLDSKVTAAANTLNIGKEAPFVSKDNFSAFTTYNLAPDLAIPGRLLVGGGVFYTSDYFAASDNVVRIPGTFSLDSVISYEINNIRVALNGYNLTDAINYGAVFNGRAAPLSGRTFLGSLSVRF